jgi:predicted dehydrogenase
MGTPLRFGIVGCGVIGATHAEAITSLPDATLVAVADSTYARAMALAQRFGARAHSSLEDMLDEEQLDVVDICTPSGMHGKHAVAAMRSGRHVIVEKPIEIGLPAIDEMLRVQDEAGVKLAVISQHRFDEASQTVRKLLDEGAFGGLVLGNAQIPWWRSQSYYDSGEWRGTRALDGGGVLMNQSIHSIDLLQWLMGSVDRVFAYTDTLTHEMETEDVAAAALHFRNGALGTIAATTGAYPGVITRVEIFGDAGTAVIENDRLALLHLRRDDDVEVGAYGGVASPTDPAAGAARDPSAVPTATHAEQIADMIRAIREDGTPLVDGHAARHPVAIILAIYESARTGREIALS